MAKARTALLTVVLAGAVAHAGDTDPRRSLVVQAVERASPAVVNISTEQVVEGRSPFPAQRDPFFDDFFHDFFDSRPRRYKATSLGSGVIVGADGTILTNEHVVLRASRIRVTLSDERTFDARPAGADDDSDIAVLRIKAPDSLPHIALGRSDDLMIGETVIAIGNPFGLSHTVTTGVVSAIGRSLNTTERTYSDFIQTDASINPGNSGGPLLNIKGELIGINTAIYGKAQGIGFAIPVDRARRVMRDLVSYGEVKRAWVGITVQDLTEELARHFGTSKGVVVLDVDAMSPGAKAGIARGDVITRVDSKDVHSRDEFEERVGGHSTTDTIVLTRHRDDGDQDVQVTAAAFPDTQADELAWQLLGMKLAEDDDGLVVDRVRMGSSAARIGLRRGDRLVGIGGAPVRSVAEFRRRMIEVRGKRSVLLSVARGPYEYNVDVPLSR
jgi:serine protease Do